MVSKHISCNHQRALDLHQLTLQRQVATVDRVEAESGASQSDSVRLAARKNDQEDREVSLQTYQDRAIAFGSAKQKKQVNKQDKTESHCPIEKARSESLIGENVPLEWLIADSFGGEASSQQVGSDAVVSRLDAESSPALETRTQALDQSSECSGTLLGQEWLLSPCA